MSPREALPGAKLFDNHLLIDPSAALFERGDPQFRAMRRKLVRGASLSLPAYTLRERALMFDAICDATLTDTPPPPSWAQSPRPLIVFTEAQATAEANVMREYLDAAARAGVPLVSIVLSCSPEENARRLQGRAVASARTKLSDTGLLAEIRDELEIYHYGELAASEVDLDVTHVSPAAAAEEIARVVRRVRV